MLGTRDCAKAPSPKKLLNTFGILNTTTKISCAELAPKKEVKTKSLRYPKILEINVKKENPAEDFQILFI
jgi:hypothetical protein